MNPALSLLPFMNDYTPAMGKSQNDPSTTKHNAIKLSYLQE